MINKILRKIVLILNNQKAINKEVILKGKKKNKIKAKFLFQKKQKQVYYIYLI